MGNRIRIFGAVLLVISMHLHALDQAAVVGQGITSQDLKDATPVATFTPQEFVKATEDHTRQQCRKRSIAATSDGSRILFDGGSYSDQEFADELIRRSTEHPIYCVEIVGPGSDMKRVSALLKKLKGTSVESLNWHPAK